MKYQRRQPSRELGQLRADLLLVNKMEFSLTGLRSASIRIVFWQTGLTWTTISADTDQIMVTQYLK